MRRAAIWGFILIILIIIAGLCQTAADPEDFTGQWYSSFDQSVYLFREGLITCSRYPVDRSAEDSISGAYSYCKGSIYLFARGIPGLEREKQLYLVCKDDGSFLCENPDGSGTVYFIRWNQ